MTTNPIILSSDKYGYIDADLLASGLSPAAKVMYCALDLFGQGQPALFNVKRKDLMDATGTTFAQASRALKELRKANIIESVGANYRFLIPTEA